MPLLTIWTGAEQRRATGTSLAAIVPISVVGASVYYFQAGTPEIDLPVAYSLIVGTTVGVVAGSLLAKKLSGHALEMVVAVVLAVVGVVEVVDALAGSPNASGSALPVFGLEQLVTIAAGGVVIGVLSGLAGLGGGIFIVPTLVLGFGITQRVAQGTSLVAILPAAAIGAWVHHRQGDVDVRGAITIAAVGAPAAIVGATLAFLLPQRTLLGLFGAFLLLAATRTWPRASTARRT